jgi:hypothetical protein
VGGLAGMPPTSVARGPERRAPRGPRTEGVGSSREDRRGYARIAEPSRRRTTAGGDRSGGPCRYAPGFCRRRRGWGWMSPGYARRREARAPHSGYVVSLLVARAHVCVHSPQVPTPPSAWPCERRGVGLERRAASSVARAFPVDETRQPRASPARRPKWGALPVCPRLLSPAGRSGEPRAVRAPKGREVLARIAGGTPGSQSPAGAERPRAATEVGDLAGMPPGSVARGLERRASGPERPEAHGVGLSPNVVTAPARTGTVV